VIQKKFQAPFLSCAFWPVPQTEVICFFATKVIWGCVESHVLPMGLIIFHKTIFFFLLLLSIHPSLFNEVANSTRGVIHRVRRSSPHICQARNSCTVGYDFPFNVLQVVWWCLGANDLSVLTWSVDMLYC